jgi:type II secretory pathway predicted ATPase ExeA
MKSLRTKLKLLDVSYSQFGALVGMSKQQVADLINHGKYPLGDRKKLRASINLALARLSIDAEIDKIDAPKETPPVAATTEGAVATPTSKDEGADQMLLRKQPLTQEAKNHFGLLANPFNGEVQADAEMFVTPDTRYVREAMWHCARNAGMLAVTGESGAGKTTIREDLIDRLERDGKQIVVIQPSVLALEDSDVKGKSLKAGSIADAVIWSIDPRAKPPGSMEAKARLMSHLLEESAKAGFMHLLIIEEAHCLPVATIKHLKRFHELKLGRKRLLGILLIGQQELRSKLSEQNFEVREFVQRCEVATLEPLDRHLRDYLQHRAGLVLRAVADFFEDAAVDAIRAKLAVGRPGDKGFRSLLYPLAVNNLCTACLNEAAELGAPKVTADIVRGV